MRRNRFDPEDDIHKAVRAEPDHYTRASRRAAGLRGGIHSPATGVLPRAVRRLLREPALAEGRIRKNRAKVNRLLAPYGRHV